MTKEQADICAALLREAKDHASAHFGYPDVKEKPDILGRMSEFVIAYMSGAIVEAQGEDDQTPAPDSR